MWTLGEIYSLSMTQLNYKCLIRDCQCTSDNDSKAFISKLISRLFFF